MKIIRASEVGTYLFCARAWWYGQKGVRISERGGNDDRFRTPPPSRAPGLASSLTRALAFILLLVALVLLAAFCTRQFV